MQGYCGRFKSMFAQTPVYFGTFSQDKTSQSSRDNQASSLFFLQLKLHRQEGGCYVNFLPYSVTRPNALMDAPLGLMPAPCIDLCMFFSMCRMYPSGRS